MVCVHMWKLENVMGLHLSFLSSRTESWSPGLHRKCFYPESHCTDTKISKIINKRLKRRSIKLGMAAHAYNLSTQEPRDEDSKFKANLGYITGSCLKKKFWNVR